MVLDVPHKTHMYYSSAVLVHSLGPRPCVFCSGLCLVYYAEAQSCCVTHLAPARAYSLLVSARVSKPLVHVSPLKPPSKGCRPCGLDACVCEQKTKVCGRIHQGSLFVLLVLYTPEALQFATQIA